jgi:peroxiredoxin Q/BCP
MAKNDAASPYALVETGKPAPEFDVTDQKGSRRSLKNLRGKWVVLYFYPKDDTPGCTVEACKFRDSLAEIKKRGAVVLGVSPDDEKSHQKFIDKFSLPFDLLADTDKKIAEAYGVWQEKSMYGRKYMGVARTTYLIDPDGKVAHRWDKVKPEGHDAEVLAKLDELRKK